MKKVISILMATALCISMFAACGGSGGSTSTTAAPAATAAAAATTAAAAAAPAATEAAPTATEAAKPSFEKMTIQVGSATQSADTDMYYVIVTETSKRLEEWTDGAVKLEYVGDGALGNDSELAEALKLGTIDGAIITSSAFAASVPCVGLFDMPYVFENADAVYDFIDNSETIHTIEHKIKDGFGATFIGCEHNGFRNTLNNIKPITKADDFSGLKIRVMESPVYMQLFSLLGANPTPMSISECLTGLEQHTVDGMDHPIAASYNAGGYKLVKYFDLTQHTTTEAAVCIRSAVFDKMSPELQELFYKAAKEAQEVERARLQELEEDMLKEMEDYGTIVGREIDVASIREKVAPMYAEYRDSLDPEVFDEAMKYLGIEF